MSSRSSMYLSFSCHHRNAEIIVLQKSEKCIGIITFLITHISILYC